MSNRQQTIDDLELMNRLCHGTVLDDAIALLKGQEPVKPIRTCRSNNELGVNGILIVGECPACGQGWINNRDNKYCGGCGRPVMWDA